MSNYTRPFLKWPGGKFRLVDTLLDTMPQKKIWVEPFAGAGAVFINHNCDSALLNDINSDLISLYKIVKEDVTTFVIEAKKLFAPNYNTRSNYYKIRSQFNKSPCSYEKSLLFLYLNRHGFNGLCRYNLDGGYNVPFGFYHKPYFPENELFAFAKKATRLNLYCEGFDKFMKRISKSSRISDMVIYCDPPYVPLTKTANFTGYAACKFGINDQEALAEAAYKLSQKGAFVCISNHDNLITRKIYHKASKILSLKVGRTISCNSKKRNPVKELLACYS